MNIVECWRQRSWYKGHIWCREWSWYATLKRLNTSRIINKRTWIWLAGILKQDSYSSAFFTVNIEIEKMIMEKMILRKKDIHNQICWLASTNMFLSFSNVHEPHRHIIVQLCPICPRLVGKEEEILSRKRLNRDKRFKSRIKEVRNLYHLQMASVMWAQY